MTLVEVLVSMGVLSLLLVLLAQTASMVASTWSLGNGRAERRQNSRALVDFIARDLRGAALPAGVDATALAAKPNLQFVLNPPTVGTDYRHPHALFWQAPVATDATAGDMAVVGYFVRWNTSGGTPRALLCRLFLNPGSPQHRIYTHKDAWITADVLEAAAKGDASTGYRGMFAENVIGFWAQCRDAEGRLISNGADGGFDSRTGYTVVDSGGSSTFFEPPVLPASVDISLAMLDSSAAAKITPAVKDTLVSMAAAAEDAAAFMEDLQNNASLRALLPGSGIQQVRVPLANAP